MVQSALDSLCAEPEGCSLAAFVDLSTRMVLRTNAANRQPQDSLNALCGQAAVLLETGQTALIAGTDVMTVALRSGVEPSDGLLCQCGLDSDYGTVLQRMRDCMSEIEGGENG